MHIFNLWSAFQMLLPLALHKIVMNVIRLVHSTPLSHPPLSGATAVYPYSDRAFLLQKIRIRAGLISGRQFT
jgi:hypothetical protein